MNVKITYSEDRLEKAVDFISKHNPAFFNRKDYIREQIYESMHRLAFDEEASWGGTMGFILTIDTEDEGIDSDIKTAHFDIYVDPDIGRDYSTLKYKEEIINDES